MSLLDSLSLDYNMPSLDVSSGGTNDLFNVVGLQMNGVTTIAFARLLVTNDTRDVAIVAGPMYLGYAYAL